MAAEVVAYRSAVVMNGGSGRASGTVHVVVFMPAVFVVVFMSAVFVVAGAVVFARAVIPVVPFVALGTIVVSFASYVVAAVGKCRGGCEYQREGNQHG